MATLRAVKKRIRTVRSTRRITKAMEMVAAAKLRRAQQRVEQAKPYAHKLDEMLSHLAAGAVGEISHPYFEERPVKKTTLVVVTSDRGLAGSFTSTSLPSLPAGLSWLLSYSSSDVVLSVAAGTALVGDYNGNGAVEQADLDLVLLNWGGAGSPPPAGWVNDLPDGLIDQGELDGILLNWGNSSPASGIASAVPAPSSLVLALVLGPYLAWTMTSRMGNAGTMPVSR